MFACWLWAIGAAATVVASSNEERIALSLADLLVSARAVLSANQGLINDPTVGDKGLSGQVVLERTIELYSETTGTDLRSVDPDSRHGRLLRAQMDAIREVMDEHQHTINRLNVGFARLVNERFKDKVGPDAEVKVTAPPDLVRNRKSRPDAWETQVIHDKFMSPDWPKGQMYGALASSKGRSAFRVLVPEYYGHGCLSCHGVPEGEMDVTGYPKEGRKLGDLGGAISITLYR
jgi:hypothetical protein